MGGWLALDEGYDVFGEQPELRIEGGYALGVTASADKGRLDRVLERDLFVRHATASTRCSPLTSILPVMPAVIRAERYSMSFLRTPIEFGGCTIQIRTTVPDRSHYRNLFLHWRKQYVIVNNITDVYMR